MEIHYLNLHEEPFNRIKKGIKNVEMRLYDKKRQLLAVGDQIILTNRESKEIIKVEVLKLQRFPTFKELYQAFLPESLGYKEGEKVSYLDMNIYYPDQLINKYGVLAISIKLI